MITNIRDSESIDFETKYVHNVYDQIATHFSQTRYRAWPSVEKFLLNLPNGSFGFDAGCGNGKNAKVNPNITMLGSDRCFKLLEILQSNGIEAVQSDILNIGFVQSRFDFGICIAVIHHISSKSRRIESIRNMLELLTSNGQLMITVWALEQEADHPSWNISDRQEALIPWKLTKQKQEDSNVAESFLRYYHLYQEGELYDDVIAAGGIIISQGYECSNWWCVATKH